MKTNSLFGGIALGALLLACSDAAVAQLARLDWKLHNVGAVRQVVTNMGALNKAATNYPGLIMSEFPPNSNEEHLYQAGPWVGGIDPNGDTLVSVTQDHYINEFYPTASRGDTIWSVGRGDTAQIPYWPNYIGLSDQDFVCRYSDDNITNIENHTPLHVEIIQTSHAWSSKPVDEFILFHYKVIPKRPIRKAYLGFWIHSAVGLANTANFIDENLMYDKTLHMVTVQDNKGGEDGTAISPLICRVLSPNTPNLTWSFGYYEHETLPRTNAQEYLAMSNGVIMEDRLDQPSRGHIILSFGPFDVMNPGDTIDVKMALVFGYGTKAAQSNAKYLDFMLTKGFNVPSPPPVPAVKIAPRSKGIHLSWFPPADSAQNPELYTDPNRGDEMLHPFEGYRIYKSPQGKNGPWTLMAQYDVVDDILPNTGLTTYEYDEYGLLNNVEYYYAVTTYSKPDTVINFPSQETSTSATALTVIPGTLPPKTVGTVSVVPNPYRGDIAYNSYQPAWETGKSGRQWMEQDRKIQFVNLPDHCQIKIYTLAGDLVNTIDHYNTSLGYENWNLTSMVGQAISSGLYLFTVEDKTNGQVQAGKFVIIK